MTAATDSASGILATFWKTASLLDRRLPGIDMDDTRLGAGELIVDTLPRNTIGKVIQPAVRQLFGSHIDEPHLSNARGTVVNVFSKSVLISITLSFILAGPVAAQEKQPKGASYSTDKDILYRTGDDLTAYMQERCRLDVYYPDGERGFATVVWFHGGGLKNGNKSVPRGLMDKGVAVVAVNYRLHPKVQSPAYIEDAAAAVAWTFGNMEKYGGSPNRIFVSGHSAGGYLTSMVGLDKRWLGAHDIDANDIAGLIPYSGHTITHFTVRAERGIDGKQPVVDDLAPLFHVRKDAPPLLLITGDRDKELLGRYEETAYLWRMMDEVGHTDTELYELEGFDHGQMAEPAHPLLLRFIEGISKRPGAATKAS